MLVLKNIRSTTSNDTNNMYYNTNDGNSDNDNAVYFANINHSNKTRNIKMNGSKINDTMQEK